MDKKVLDKFIEKYNLSGQIESVKWSVDNTEKTLKVAAKSEDRNLIVYVDVLNFSGIDDTIEFGVYDTKKFKQMMNIFDSGFEIRVNKKDNEVRSLDLYTDTLEAKFVASSLSVVSSVPVPKETPEFQVEILIDESFTDRFNKAKSALSKTETFTLINDKKGDLKLILGYSSNNTDRVTINVQPDGEKKTLVAPLHFQSDVLKAILAANQECETSVLKVSDRGLAHISFESNDFKSNYYMVAIPDID